MGVELFLIGLGLLAKGTLFGLNLLALLFLRHLSLFQLNLVQVI